MISQHRLTRSRFWMPGIQLIAPVESQKGPTSFLNEVFRLDLHFLTLPGFAVPIAMPEPRTDPQAPFQERACPWPWKRFWFQIWYRYRDRFQHLIFRNYIFLWTGFGSASWELLGPDACDISPICIFIEHHRRFESCCFADRDFSWKFGKRIRGRLSPFLWYFLHLNWFSLKGESEMEYDSLLLFDDEDDLFSSAVKASRQPKSVSKPTSSSSRKPKQCACCGCTRFILLLNNHSSHF